MSMEEAPQRGGYVLAAQSLKQAHASRVSHQATEGNTATLQIVCQNTELKDKYILVQNNFEIQAVIFIILFFINFLKILRRHGSRFFFFFLPKQTYL